MPKEAYSYYEKHPWKIIEKGYDPSRNEVSESVFALANEYTGVRGVIDEGVSAKSLRGTYFNGIYELGEDTGAPGYKGIVRDTHFMVNAVDWLYTSITVDNEPLNISKNTTKDFERVLDMQTGILTRSFTLVTDKQKAVRFTFERLLSMKDVKHAYQTIRVESDEAVNIKLKTGLDFSILHFGKTNYWDIEKQNIDEASATLIGVTKNTKQSLFAHYSIHTNNDVAPDTFENKKIIGHTLQTTIDKGSPLSFEKRVTLNASKEPVKSVQAYEDASLELINQTPYSVAKDTQKTYWNSVWEKSDIEIGGDVTNQQGLRFCIYQLQQTYQGYDKHNNIGAKGLTGEAYSGHAFWDSETYCLPFYLLNNTDAARNLLLFRYNTLKQAQNRARDLDCKGACYPVATLNGDEASTLWQHSNLQFQPSTAVAYAIWHYMRLTDDQEFLKNYGAKMLLEISRFLYSRGQWNQDHTKFGYYGVMGPDEFQMMVHHNAYTNYMSKRTLNYTIEVLSSMDEETQKALGLENDELDKFTTISDAIYLPKDDATGIFEQHEGFFDLPHIDINSIPKEDFPLYHNWSYDRIYRNDMIKQPDVLMFLFLHNQSFTKDEKRANYDYYEPRTIHESSLSPSIHSIFALELDKFDEGLNFFTFATRMDLDDYNRNSNEGLHTTSIAAAWMNVVYGFGGVRTDGESLSLAPKIPDYWTHYSFNIQYKNRTLAIKVTHDDLTITNDGPPIELIVDGQQETIDETWSKAR